MKIKEFFLPDNIKPLPLKENLLRYLSMILLIAGCYFLNMNSSLWFNFDMMNETVAVLGIIIKKTDFFITDISFPEFTNLIYLICSSILGLAAIFAVIAVYGLKNFHNSLKGFKISKNLIYIAVIIAVYLIASFILRKTGIYSGNGTGFSVNIYGKSGGARTTGFLTLGLVFPVLEEFAFRFTFYQIFRAKINFIFSALISSLIFGVIHYGFGSIKIWLGILTGIFFCWLYEKSRNILVPAAVHSLSNIINILFM